MINYQSIDISSGVFDVATAEREEVIRNLRILFTTPVGTVPYDRDFGINIDFIDEPTTIAQGRMMVEYKEKAQIYEPRAIIQSVTYTGDPSSGTLIPKVVIKIDLEAE